ncbi:MAG: hypothetical protein AB1714_18750 [Acidobacteriota bacterium]
MRWQRRVGAVLVVLGLIGFLTVADDLRHTGEIWGVGAILAAGLMLLATGSKHPLTRRFSPHWLGFGLLAGAVLGAGLDKMPLGVGLGSAVGMLAALCLAKRQN